jgi:uncharacterized membrane protein
MTTAGLVLFALARCYLAPALAALITASFYGANAVVGPTLANFHDSSQTPLFVFTLLLALERGWWWLFSIMALLIPLVREDAGLILFSIGFYLALSRRFPRIGLTLCVLSFAYMLVLTNLIMPSFSADVSRRFMLERFGQYATGEEASTLEILWGMVSNPWRLIVELFSPPSQTIRYLLGQWLPLAFIPAISPTAWMVAGFPLLNLLLGKGESVLAINIRYALTVVPGLFYGAILWWSHHRQIVPSRFKTFWIACISLSLIFTIASNPNRTLSFLIPDAVQPWVYVSLPQQWRHASQIRSLLAQIPPDASVSATTYLVPHLSSRRDIIRFPEQYKFRNDARAIASVDYVAADLWQLQQYQLAFKSDRQILKASVDRINELTQHQNYGMTTFREGVILLQHGQPTTPKTASDWLGYQREISTIIQSPQ